MQNSQFIAERIKEEIKEQSKSIKDTLSDLHMGINTISALSKGKEISYVKMAEFAEYLNCSVDYLLGRTDNPRSHTITGSDLEDIKKTLNPDLSDSELECLKKFNKLEDIDKGRILDRMDTIFDSYSPEQKESVS